MTRETKRLLEEARKHACDDSPTYVRSQVRMTLAQVTDGLLRATEKLNEKSRTPSPPMQEVRRA